MVAVISVRMIMYAALSEVEKMGRYDQDNSWYEQPGFIMNEEQFQQEEHKTGTEQKKRQAVMMVFLVSVIKRVRADQE